MSSSKRQRFVAGPLRSITTGVGVDVGKVGPGGRTAGAESAAAVAATEVAEAERAVAVAATTVSVGARFGAGVGVTVPGSGRGFVPGSRGPAVAVPDDDAS